MLFLVCKLLTCSLCSQISTLESEWWLNLSKLSHFLLEGFLNSLYIGFVLLLCVWASRQAQDSVISCVSLGRDYRFWTNGKNVCHYKTIIVFAIPFSAAVNCLLSLTKSDLSLRFKVLKVSGITTSMPS